MGLIVFIHSVFFGNSRAGSVPPNFNSGLDLLLFSSEKWHVKIKIQIK